MATFRNRTKVLLSTLCMLALFAGGVRAADGDPAPTPPAPPTPVVTPPAPAAGENDPVALVTAAERAFLYAASDLKARITMVLYDKDGKTRNRVMTMLRRNADKGDDQKYFIYFHEPGDVRGMTFMVFKYLDKEDDRWLFIPAVDLVKHIAASDSRSSFVGSDFTYEDISGRPIASDTHTFVKSEKLGDRDCFVVQSVPKTPVEFTKRLMWIDKENMLPLKEEYYDAQNELARVYTADKIEDVAVGEGADKKMVPTVTKRVMKNLKSGHYTEVTFSSVSYNLGLKDEDFSERRLRKPPKEWTAK